jgi:hypothetical protein
MNPRLGKFKCVPILDLLTNESNSDADDRDDKDTPGQ